MTQRRLSPSVTLIASAINALPDSKSRFLEPYGGRRAVVQILVAAANKLLQQENLEASHISEEGIPE